MKLGSFILLQCPPSKTNKQAFDEVVEQVVLTEQMGFDQIYLAEHHFSPYSILADPLVLASHIAAKTKRIKIGLAVAVIPFHNPVKLAEQAAMVDILSDGRLVLGVGRGYQRQEFDKLSLNIGDSRGMMVEGLEVLHKSWMEEEWTYKGKYYNYPVKQTIYPKPVQKPIPTPVATGGTKETMEWVAKKGIPFISGGAFPELEGIKARLDKYRADMKAAGFSDAHITQCVKDSPFSRRIYVGKNDKDSYERPREYVMWFENALMKEGLPQLGVSPEQDAAYHDHLARMTERSKQPYDHKFKQELYATPDGVIDHIKTMESYGIENMIFWFNFGGMPRDMVLESMQRFSDNVIPVFKGSKKGK